MSTCRYSWSSASSSVPAWDHGSPTSPESESISSASSYFDPFNDTTFGPDLNSNRRILHLEDGLNAMWRAQVKDCTRKAEEWRWKCYQLSDEVARLRHQVDQLKRDRDDLQLETIATGTANLVFGLNNDDDTGSFIQTTLPTAPVSCRWDGKRWVPVVPVATFKPQIDPTKSMSKQNPPPCNAYYLLGECEVPRCRFCHLYDLSENQISEMRRGAKFHLCNAVQNGVECPDGANCIYGHHCPRGPSCSRQHCAFNDEQHRIVPLPRPSIYRRDSYVSVSRQQTPQSIRYETYY